MGRALAIVCAMVVAAGCYEPGYRDCAITCATSSACPDGLACVAGVCRTGGDGEGACPPLTGDGGTDDVALPGVADEDSDGLPDVSDPCPISANNADADGDGVGDPCEPAASGTDRIVLFEGFHDVAPAGAVLEGAWTFGGGKARIASAANQAASVLFPLTVPRARRETILARVTIDALFSTPSDPTGAGVVTQADAAAAMGIQCALGRDPGTGTDHLILTKVAAAADVNFRSNASIATVGAAAIIQLTRNPANNTFACTIPGNIIAGIPDPLPNPGAPHAGIRTRSMSASFDWVMIVETQ